MSLNQAVAAIKAGDKATGKKLLLELLETDHSNENAWLWMTKVVESKVERIECLQKALSINPNNQAAQQGLARLQQKKARPGKSFVMRLARLQQKKARPGKSSVIKPLKKKTLAIRKQPYLLISAAIVLCLCVGCGLFNVFLLSLRSEQPGPQQPAAVAPKSTPPALQMQQYIQEVDEKSQIMFQAFIELGDLLQSTHGLETGLEPSLKADIATRIDIIHRIYEDLAKIVPPPDLAQIHEAFLSRVAECDEATYYLFRGLDNKNQDDLSKAGDLADGCGQKMSLYNAEDR